MILKDYSNVIRIYETLILKELIIWMLNAQNMLSIVPQSLEA